MTLRLFSSIYPRPYLMMDFSLNGGASDLKETPASKTFSMSLCRKT